ncbi:MAG: hypothetical protein TREMPRED_002239 [Tremellales sp. Tagirdzhanova-0007]|nr:MAG: hypothetical protein TREMPRED_002239 [Tremellales sp. Tagirdzhanova-0007]
MNLRLVIWLCTKIWRSGEVNETLHFLLDHPRRCFLYLFPSHQTWYLVLTLVVFTCVEMFGFLVLNIGLPVITDLSGWEMFSDGLLQSLSIRAAGFGVVPVANMAPSVLWVFCLFLMILWPLFMKTDRFLYVVLMYVSIYPIAMSVRSTNVYEEGALGVYKHQDPEYGSDEEPQFQGRRGEIFSKYLSWHVRRQLAFDIWPLALSIILIACAERGKLLDPSKSAWFTIFRIIFDCTSAYSTIGLSLGTPNNNYSFSGEFGTVSKLIVILVMLRGRWLPYSRIEVGSFKSASTGRHRGLPVAIDRAILLPREYQRIDRRNSGANGPAADKQFDNGQDPLVNGSLATAPARAKMT